MLLSLVLTLVHSKRISPASDGYHVKHDVSRNQFSWFALGDWGGRFVPGVDKQNHFGRFTFISSLARKVKPV